MLKFFIVNNTVDGLWIFNLTKFCGFFTDKSFWSFSSSSFPDSQFVIDVLVMFSNK